MIILIPPSEGKNPGGIGLWRTNDGQFGRQLGQSREEVLRGLRSTNPSWLKVHGATADKATATNRRLATASALPARDRYKGVVYQGIDYPSLPRSDQRLANQSIHIISGLTGIARFDDDIPDYRAPIDSRVDGVGSLNKYWKPHLEPVLLQLSKNHVIVDVLPRAHRAAMTPVGDWRTVDIVDTSGTGGHAAKHAKGRFVRWLLNHEPDEIGTWRDGSWRAVVR